MNSSQPYQVTGLHLTDMPVPPVYDPSNTDIPPINDPNKAPPERLPEDGDLPPLKLPERQDDDPTEDIPDPDNDLPARPDPGVTDPDIGNRSVPQGS